MPALAACPNAVLVTTWFGVGRMVDHFDIPMGRVRFVPGSFPMSVPHAVDDFGALVRDYVEEALLLGARLISPWPAWLDPAKWNVHLQRVHAMPIDTVASCHAPAIQGRDIECAFDVLGTAPHLDPWPELSQQDLDQWMAAAGIGPS